MACPTSPLEAPEDPYKTPQNPPHQPSEKTDSGVHTPIANASDAGVPPDPLPSDAGQAASPQNNGSMADAGIPASITDAGTAAPITDAGTTAPIIDAGPPENPEEAFDAGGPACDVPLQVTPTEIFTLPYHLHTFQCEGGGGPCEFEITNEDTESHINRSTGAYLSGGQAPFQDYLRISEPVCGFEILLTVEVVLPMVLTPQNPYLPPDGNLFFQSTGGSGNASFSIIQNETGASVDNELRRYQAGPVPGHDVIRGFDPLSGDSDTIDVWVQSGFQLEVSPQTIVLPQGQKALLQFNGTGAYQTNVTNDFISLENDWVTGLLPGAGTLVIQDVFTTLEVDMPYHVLAPQNLDLVTMGDRQQEPLLFAIPDITGDGEEDLLLGLWYADITGKNSGAVYLYESTETGFAPEPLQILSGKSRNDFFGKSMAFGDINNDGLPDLLVGAYGADEGLSNNGGAYLHLGTGSGFSVEPNRIYVGIEGSDNLGTGVGICDVNGDGRQDVILGAALAEDRESDPRENSQGALYIYLGIDGGLPTNLDQIVFGQAWDFEDSKFIFQNEARLGNFIDTGDINGDGLCDVISSNWRYRTGGNNRQDGAVFVYPGRAPAGFSLGGIESQPAWGIIASGSEDDDREMARFLEVADMNDDGQDDILVSHWYDAPSSNRQGTLKIFLGRGLSVETPLIVNADEHDWHVQGESSGDHLGIYSQVGDVNGDNILDVIVGSPQGGERMTDGSNHRVGHVGVYLGQENDVPKPTPHIVSHGEVSGDWWGHAVASFSRTDHNFRRNGLIVYASRKDKNDQKKMPHLALTEVVFDSPNAQDAGPLPFSDCQIELSRPIPMLYAHETPEQSVILNLPVKIEQTDGGMFAMDAGAGHTIHDGGNSNAIDAPPHQPPLAQARFVGTGEMPHHLDEEGWTTLTYSGETNGFWSMTGMLTTPQYGLVSLMGRYQTPAQEWVYCDASFTEDTFATSATYQQDIRYELDTPSGYGGAEMGRAMAFVPDFFGPGADALAVGGNRASTGSQQTQSGTVNIYQRNEEAFQLAPSMVLAEYRGHTGYDLLGWYMSAAGTFHGAETSSLAVIAEYDDIPNSSGRSGWEVESNCPNSNSLDNAGSLAIFPGGELSTDEENNLPANRDPSMIVFGPQPNKRLHRVAGQMDINNDGLDDLVVTSRYSKSGSEPNNHCSDNNCGGFGVIWGRPTLEENTYVTCETDVWVFGREHNAEVGTSVTGIGDLNNDGCDDFAVGARSADYGYNNQGAVHVIFGFGHSNCPAEPLEVVLTPQVNSGQMGVSIDGGLDVTGDGIPDIVVGAHQTRNEGNAMGAAYLISGAYVADLFSQATPASQAELPNFMPLGNGTHPFARIMGEATGDEFGQAVTLVPHLHSPNVAGIAVGAPFSSSLGFDRTGGVWGYTYDVNTLGFSSSAVFAVAGESDRPDSRMGISVDAAELGGRVFVTVGGDFLSSVEVDQGACFTWEMTVNNP